MSTTIHQPSDLNRSYRAILDEARVSRARVRDTDGFCLLVIPEERVGALEAVSDATASFLVLEGVVGHGEGDHSPTIAEFGAWPWLRVFDREDLEEFITEMRESLVLAARERSGRAVGDTLQAWYNTALSLDDPLRRDILLGDNSNDDNFVEVDRPAAAD
jgi:hypothetical protein